MTGSNIIIGNRVKFFREGASFTVPSAGNAGIAALPGAADAGWVEFGDVDELGITPEGEMREVWSPSAGGMHKLKNIVDTKPKLTVDFRTQVLTPLAYELVFKTDVLTGASTTHAPLAKPSKKGWLQIIQKNSNGDDFNELFLFVHLKVNGKVDMNDDVVRVSLQATVLDSTLNAGDLA